MDWLQASILAMIQGITEFLPISSSAHLLLPALLLDWPDQGLTFDVAVHVGSLLAVIVYLRQELQQLIQGCWHSTVRWQMNPHAWQAWSIVLATLPAVVLGFLLKDWIELHLRALWVIAVATLLFGGLLGWADWRGNRYLSLEQLGWRHALLIGVAQALALIPGTSRSGITMTAALMLGYQRGAAARFSFLLSIPIIIAAGTLAGLELLTVSKTIDWSTLLVGIVVSFMSAWCCIHWFLRTIERFGMWPFVVYRLALGGILLWLIGSP